MQRIQEEQQFQKYLELERQEVEAQFDAFEELLRNCGARIRPGSKLEEALLLARHLKYIRADGAALPSLTPDEEDDMLRRVCWLGTMVPKVLAATQHQDFQEIVPHLRLVIDGEFAQSVPGDPNEDSDKLFELVVALAIMPNATALKMDTGGTANPDLLFDFEGKRWAIACKAVYSKRPETYRDHVIKGASQIEKSDASRGVVCVSLRNQIQQEIFMPRQGDKLIGMPKSAIHELLASEQARIEQQLIEPVAADLVRDLSSRTKTERDVLHVLAGCARTGSPRHVRMTHFARIMNIGEADPRLVDALNAGLQG